MRVLSEGTLSYANGLLRVDDWDVNVGVHYRECDAVNGNLGKEQLNVTQRAFIAAVLIHVGRRSAGIELQPPDELRVPEVIDIEAERLARDVLAGLAPKPKKRPWWRVWG